MSRLRPTRRALWIAAVGVLLLGAIAIAAGCAGSLKSFAYSGFSRDGWQQPERVIEALEVAPGSRVADLGAGGGYFTFRLADAVGPDGLVYAVDLDLDMVNYLESEIEDREVKNVRVVLAKAHDPLLPKPVDLVLTVNTFHHLDARPDYFSRLRKRLRPGARVAIIDYREGEHGTPKETVVTDMEAAGYSMAADHGFLEKQSFLVFAPRP